MTYTLGLTGPVSFDQSAVLLEDGKIIAAVEEERFTGVKHHRYGPPVNAVKYCLDYAQIKASDLDSVAIGWGSRGYWIKSIASFALNRPFMLCDAPTYISHLRRYWGADFLKGYNGKVRYYRHHLTHLASAFYCSGFDKANIISIDECGETESTLMGIGTGEEIEVLKSFNYLNSLGRLYRQTTEYLGFRGNSDEYKVMGLAGYGKPDLGTEHLLKMTGRGYSLETRHFYTILVKSILRKITRVLATEGKKLEYDKYFNYGPIRGEKENLSDHHKNIAATIQDLYEQVLLHLAKLLYDQTGVKKFAIAGGCGLNCMANGRLLKQDFVNDLFVHPASSDAGSALGAALIEAGNEYKVKARLRDVGLGPGYSNEEIEVSLKKKDMEYEKIDDIEKTAAELLGENKIIGWFQGRMEFGPRSLGYRSILANPMIAENKDRVNNIKNRELWRPLAPSLLEESLDDFFDIHHVNDFMTVVQDVKDDMKDRIPAVVHVDGSTRYQTVSKQRNKYHGLLSEFNRLTDVPVVLNTSFNDRGQPIVNDPSMALETYEKNGLDCLVIGDYLVR